MYASVVPLVSIPCHRNRCIRIPVSRRSWAQRNARGWGRRLSGGTTEGTESAPCTFCLLRRRVKHSSHLNSELDFCFSKCSYHLCCVLVMDIVYKWKQKKYKQPKKQVRNRKIHIAIHLLFTYPSTKHGEPHQKKWNLRCYGVQALKQVIAIDKDVVLQHS